MICKAGFVVYWEGTRINGMQCRQAPMHSLVRCWCLKVFQVILHFLGFAAFLGPVVFIELPVAILELVNGEGFSSSMDGDGWLKNARMVLIIMRILCTSKENTAAVEQNHMKLLSTRTC